MTVYKIKSETADYDGSGYAMAAIKNSEAVQIKYLRDIVPEYDEDDCDEDLPALI